MIIDTTARPEGLGDQLDRFFNLSGQKIKRLNASWDPCKGSPVFTERGEYASRGWTEWTQGFQFGCQLLQFDATEDAEFLAMGRANTIRYMAPHVSHIGVHDHGFNNVSTYGVLRRLLLEGRTQEDERALETYELALKVSGAVQAARWSTTADGKGYIYSFNGPHSLFSDTIRSCRALTLAARLGHCLMGEGDRRISLMRRAIEHIETTCRYNVYYGQGRDIYDVPGRVVHESIFNRNDGAYRCPSTQQGYSPFSTWTRGLAWVLLGCAEELEFFTTLRDSINEDGLNLPDCERTMLEAARATADFFIANTATDGIPYWDTGAPGLAQMPDWRDTPSQPDNPFEPVDSSAAAIAAQGLLRLGRFLGEQSNEGARYWQAGLTVANTLLAPPYLSTDVNHHGLLLHSIYHRPNGWDHTPEGKQIPQGESSMWGDYHAMELAVYLKRILEQGRYLTFFGE